MAAGDWAPSVCWLHPGILHPSGKCDQRFCVSAVKSLIFALKIKFRLCTLLGFFVGPGGGGGGE